MVQKLCFVRSKSYSWVSRYYLQINDMCGNTNGVSADPFPDTFFQSSLSILVYKYLLSRDVQDKQEAVNKFILFL